jgi:hypothetical protein
MGVREWVDTGAGFSIEGPSSITVAFASLGCGGRGGGRRGGVRRGGVRRSGARRGGSPL